MGNYFQTKYTILYILGVDKIIITLFIMNEIL